MKAREVNIELRDVSLTGHMYIPEYPSGIVIVARGKNCSEYRNRHAQLFSLLAGENMGVLFSYLLDPPDEQDYDNPFDIELMTNRLMQITSWVLSHAPFKDIPVGYFAVNTAAAASLQAMATMNSQAIAAVCLAGRPDLSRDILPSLTGAALLITAAEDIYITELNRQAASLLTCEKRHIVLEGSPASFDDLPQSAKIAKLAADWFSYHLSNAMVPQLTDTW